MILNNLVNGTVIDATPLNQNFKDSFFQGVFRPTLGNVGVDVTTAATQLLAADANRKIILIKNNGAATIYLGLTNGVLATNGFPLDPSQSIILYETATVYAIASTGTVDVRVLTAV
jgi:hypothetical protein